ncbi:MAG: M1 family metallopeptidase, partial [Clostridiales Family XIII bacterium]|nr:M1 family metallopeptidase [Clostridiales Family XIII bacterium]
MSIRKYNYKFGRVTAIALTLALALSVFTPIGAFADETSTVEVEAQAAPTSSVKTEVDWFDDVYDGIEPGHVFESVTWERLNYILGYGPLTGGNNATDSATALETPIVDGPFATTPYPGGNFAIVFGGPENASSQAALKYINEVAIAKGVQKIYHFDPKLDGGRDGNTNQAPGAELDITNTQLNSMWGDLWTHSRGWGTKDRLKNIAPEYDSSSTYLFIYNKDNLNGGVSEPIIAGKVFKGDTLTGADADTYKAEIANIFDAAGLDGENKANISTYSHIDYYQSRINHVPATQTAGVGIAVEDKADFPVQTITYPELIHLLETDGDFAILFGGTWCPYTAPTIATAAKAAKANGVNKIYQFDFRLDASSATGIRHIRDNTNNGGFAYLFGDIVNDFLSNIELPLIGAQSTGAGMGGLATPVVYYPHNDTTKDSISQQRLGVPLHFQYNKNNIDSKGASAPIASQWLGYAPFIGRVHSYAWFTADSLKNYFAKPDVRITGQASGEGTTGQAVAGLGRHVDPDFDIVTQENNLNNGLASATLAVPALYDFFAGVTENRTVSVSAWDDKPVGNPVDTSEPSETGGCGTGTNSISDEVESPILGQNGEVTYDVSNYDIQLSYARPIGNTPAGYRAKTTISAKALARLDTISFDFAVDNVRKVTVNGTTASFVKDYNDAEDTYKLIVTPATTVAKNATFEVVVDYYAYTSTDYQFGGSKTQGFLPSVNSEGATTVGEPNGPLFWFPSNNNTTDRATYSVHLTSPRSLVGVSAGILKDKESHGTVVTTHWEQSSPTLPYLEFASFGNYIEFEQEITLTDGTKIPALSYIDKKLYETSGPIAKANAYAYAEKLQDYIQWAESKFGKYPQKAAGFIFESINGDTANHENVGRPVYAGIPDKGVFVHELLHQWFGDSVAIANWEDLWLNEGFAVYLTNVFYAEQTNTVPNGDIQALYADWFAAQEDEAFWGLAPANPKNSYNLFGNGTYGRGSYALAALRNAIGDDNFFKLLQTWAKRYAGKAATTENFTALAEEVTNVDLDEFFETWLYGTEKPASFPTAEFKGKEIVNQSLPTITGTKAVGQKLTASNGTWDPTPDSYTYQWYASGKSISKATKNTYTLTSAEKGKAITVKVTAVKASYDNVSATSKATAAIKAGTIAKGTVKISGTAKVGKKLTAKTGSKWTSSTKFTYKWYANGKAISKATSKTLKLKKAQQGKKITVKVTAKKSGYTTVTKTSA